jgi:hypothetical protein
VKVRQARRVHGHSGSIAEGLFCGNAAGCDLAGRVVDYDARAAGADNASSSPERFSIHSEADLTRGGRSVLDIRPLLWSSDGWPIAGDNPAATTGTHCALNL